MPKISVEHSCQIRALYQISNVRGKNLLQMFPQYSKVQVDVHAKKPINGEPVFDHRARKFSVHDERSMKQTIPKRCWKFYIKALAIRIWHISRIKQDIPKTFELRRLQVFTITEKGAHIREKPDTTT